MAVVQQSIQLGYSAQQMYALVEDIEAYPLFLPWCDSVNVQRDSVNHTVIAEMHMNVMGMKQKFTTRNINTKPVSIHMQLEEGPFKELDGEWTFTAIDDTHCKVSLSMKYIFSNVLLEKMIGPFFNVITLDLISAFRQRAQKIYG